MLYSCGTNYHSKTYTYPLCINQEKDTSFVLNETTTYLNEKNFGQLNVLFLDKDKREPISYAIISIFSINNDLHYSSISDSSGIAEFQLQDGKYVMQFQAPGKMGIRDTIRIQQNQLKEFTVLLGKANAVIDIIYTSEKRLSKRELKKIKRELENE